MKKSLFSRLAAVVRVCMLGACLTMASQNSAVVVTDGNVAQREMTPDKTNGGWVSPVFTKQEAGRLGHNKGSDTPVLGCLKDNRLSAEAFFGN